MAAIKETPHLDLMTIVGEVVFIAVLALVAGINDQLEAIVMTVLVGLWLAYLVNYGPTLMGDLKWRS